MTLLDSGAPWQLFWIHEVILLDSERPEVTLLQRCKMHAVFCPTLFSDPVSSAELTVQEEAS